jgi:hypothetical protein
VLFILLYGVTSHYIIDQSMISIYYVYKKNNNKIKIIKIYGKQRVNIIMMLYYIIGKLLPRIYILYKSLLHTCEPSGEGHFSPDFEGPSIIGYH